MPVTQDSVSPRVVGTVPFSQESVFRIKKKYAIAVDLKVLQVEGESEMEH